MMMDEDLHLQYKLFIPSICYLLFLSNNAWEDDTIIRISQTIASAGNLTVGFVTLNQNQYMNRDLLLTL